MHELGHCARWDRLSLNFDKGRLLCRWMALDRSFTMLTEPRIVDPRLDSSHERMHCRSQLKVLPFGTLVLFACLSDSPVLPFEQQLSPGAWGVAEAEHAKPIVSIPSR